MPSNIFSNVPANEDASLSQFNDLPIELPHIMWRHALPGARIFIYANDVCEQTLAWIGGDKCGQMNQ